MTLGPLGLPTLRPSNSFAEGSPVKTCPPLASAVASQVLAAACGLNSVESWQSYARSGSWSRMSPAERVLGLTKSLGTWQSSGMRSYRSRLRQAMLGLHTGAHEFSSLLPTLTRTANLLAPSMQKWPAHRRLPTLSALSYGSNRGGAAGRVGQVRLSLQTRDEKGLAPRRSRGGPDLPHVLGGALNPAFCEWLMGFPIGWTRVMPVRGLQVTR
jgi:hypothetical protein